MGVFEPISNFRCRIFFKKFKVVVVTFVCALRRVYSNSQCLEIEEVRQREESHA